MLTKFHNANTAYSKLSNGRERNKAKNNKASFNFIIQIKFKVRILPNPSLLPKH